jgi:RHS repeat-associated protein
MYNQMLQNGLLEGVLGGRKAFGMGIKNREYVAFKDFRYKFNGKETDSETGTQDYGKRIYNPSLGRFFSVDPLSKSYSSLSTYQFASNRPINAIDLDGLESADVYHYLDAEGKYLGSTEIKVREKNGVLGDGILVHQMIMTSDNPGGMVQNFSFKDDFEKARYYEVAEVQSNSAQTERNNAKVAKMKEMQFDLTFPISKGFKEFKRFLKKLDIKMQGHSDQANTGYTTKQDIQVGLAVTSIIVTGGLATEAVLAGASYTAIAGETAIPLVFDLDQATTNGQGNSIVERTILNDNPTAKAAYNGVQVLFGGYSKAQNIVEIGTEGVTTFKAVDYLNGSVGIGNDAVSTGESVIEAQKKK